VCTARVVLAGKFDPERNVAAVARVALDVDGMGGEAVMVLMSCPAFTVSRVTQGRHGFGIRVAMHQHESFVGLASPTKRALQMGGPDGRANVSPWDAR
jgi:hypothetical protein